MADFQRFMQARGGGPLNAAREDIEEWLDAKGGISSNSRAAYISNVHAFYECMIDCELLLEDPTKRVSRPKVRLGLPRPILDEDLQVALKYARPRERCFVALAAFAGLRCQEIAHLDVENLIWSSNLIHVTEFAAKGGKERMIPIHPEVERAIKAYGCPKQGAMFVGQGRRRHSPERVSQIGNEYLHDAGIQATMHQLRHWFGTNVARSGSLRAAQQLMGHSDPRTTAIYTKVTVDDMRDVVAALPSL